MKFYGKANETASAIIDRFKTGDVPAALAQVFVSRSDHVPSATWSFGNRFVQAINGTCDARGFKQWQAAGRTVKKGSTSFRILAPCTKQIETDDGEKRCIVYGFRGIPVFSVEQTEIVDAEKWEAAGGVDRTEESRLQELPLRAVAESWGLSVTSYSGKGARYRGYYSGSNRTIALGVENTATWCHELIHAADDRSGTITKLPGQQPDNEIVAELGGAVLLTLLGHDTSADVGGAWDYVKRYAGNDDAKAVKLCMRLVDRTCRCVAAVLAAHESATVHELAA